MKNNKGFSLVEMLAVVVILGILFGIGVAAYSLYINKAKQDAYNSMVSSAEHAMEEYVMDHPGVDSVYFDELYEEEYLERPTDPSDKGNDCKGKVVSSLDPTTSTGALEKYNYKVSICCANYNYTYDSSTGYKIKDKNCKAEPFSQETINLIKEKKIKVLNVYSSSGVQNNLKNWMNSYGKLDGVQIINVTPVFVDTFNSNPSLYLGSKNDWKYDVVVFGFADCYNSKDLNANSASKVRDFINDGGAVIFGHDTITKGCGNHKNFVSLEDTVGLTATTDLTWTGKTKVVIRKRGVFTEYPYNIGNINTVLTIPNSHVYGQEANGATVWLTFDGIGDPNKSIYLSTYGNNAFIQTGHSGGTATVQEQQIIANIIFYMVAQQYGAD